MLQITVLVSIDSSQTEIDKAVEILQGLRRDSVEARRVEVADQFVPETETLHDERPSTDTGESIPETETLHDERPSTDTGESIPETETLHDERPSTDTGGPTQQRFDKHDIPFDAQYCGEAKDPYYGSGPRLGQWKKKRGLSDQIYDQWYARARQSTGTTQLESDPEVDAAAAFGAVKATVEPPPAGQPQNAQEFMIWISERQAAGELNDNDLHKAYRDTGIAGVHMLFDPAANPGVIEERVKALHARLMLSINQ